MDEATRKALIGQYRDGYKAVAETLLKISAEELEARPAPDKWCVREIVHHLADSEMIAAVRLRFLLAMDRPTIQGYDQDEFARRLRYDRAYEMSLELFRCARESTAELLERLSPADWRREGTHTELGPYSVEKWLEIYAAHAHKHATQIRAARGAAKK
ncbi:MAG TPA: DinB family protein [Vicinamibacterales bacterium]|nr:DinB family protein [Vicinamibacterales bacterium]